MAANMDTLARRSINISTNIRSTKKNTERRKMMMKKNLQRSTSTGNTKSTKRGLTPVMMRAMKMTRKSYVQKLMGKRLMGKRKRMDWMKEGNFEI